MLTKRPLRQTKAYLNGHWQDAASGSTFSVMDPANQCVIADVADCGEREAARAILAAGDALTTWRNRTAADRGAMLHAWYELVVEHAEELAELMTAEQGKPLAEALGEVRYGADYIKWYAAESERVVGELLPPPKSGQRILVTKEPVGVVVAITPWNFPIAMITRKVAPALAAGCTVIVKPAEETPLCAIALAELADRAGLPKGVLNVLPTSQPKALAKVLLESDTVRKLSFTGSTTVGKQLMAQCAPTLKKLSLELGGNAPFIVFADADVEGAVAGAMQSKFRNGGQTCICPNRFLIHESILEAFLSGLETQVAELSVGPGRSDGVAIGPLINEAAVEKVEGLLNSAVSQGAKIIVGGRRHALGGFFFQPTILTEVTLRMAISREEIFGPVVTIATFHTEAEVIKLANDTPAGLAAYFYGQSQAQIWRVAGALAYGMIGINTGAISNPAAPFGGVKESGFGREGGKYGIDEYLVTKYLCWQYESA